MKKNIKLIYIAGFGRSGSTLLEKIFNESNNVFSIGEVRNILKRSFINNQLCSCGSPFYKCKFWNNILADSIYTKNKILLYDTLLALNKINRIRYVPTTLSDNKNKKFENYFAKYECFIKDLFYHIDNQVDASILLDTSKDPSYGLYLSTLDFIDLMVIHIVRDSRGVCYSWQKKKKRPEIYWKDSYMTKLGPVRSSFEWLVHNILAELLVSRNQNSIRIRYEDLVSNPMMVINNIERFFSIKFNNIDLNNGVLKLNKQSHSVSGNPNRFIRSELKVEPDFKWKKMLDSKSKFISTAMNLPLLFRYKYLF